ncbi:MULTISPECIES: hypothetical protein [Roseateles]|uniref:Acid shock protein n=1 Tax=Pelomonas caseinilytica TaxID=2906763 RepID=A0ABS8XJ36_9BURK|nr:MULTISPECIES: hypothetical protein [unclassified Roseateles]MCE4539028.1 hypothetical protein [Pelomonas sp. P7]HEV6968941.1 hypothetical protein [Roseateles sp.]
MIKSLLTATALAVALAAPAAQARTVKHHSHATSGVKAQATTKKTSKAKPKKHAAKKSTHRKNA